VSTAIKTGMSGEERALRRLAMQIATQLPADEKSATRVVELLGEIVMWREGAASGCEERRRYLRVV
jgi:hypothetical protein